MNARILVVDDSPTIRKIATRILAQRGYETREASDGKEAIDVLRSGPIDLVLLDFVMPNMNGFQFCRVLRADENLKFMPVVLMSAKSDRIRERFVAQTGALDAIAKPFDAQALDAVVEHSLRRVREGRGSEVDVSTGANDIFEDADDDDPTIGPGSVAGESMIESQRATTRVRVAGFFAQKLAEQLEGAFGLSKDELLSTLAERFPPQVAREFLASAAFIDGGVTLSGNLSTIPLSAVLQILGSEGQNGELSLVRGQTEIVALFRDGLVDLVETRGGAAEYRLGRYLVEAGAISPDELDEWLASLGSHDSSTIHRKVRIGQQLIQSGRVSSENLRNALRRQSSELVYEVLRWKDGFFEFRRDATMPRVDDTALGLHVSQLILEGYRRMEDWRHIEATLGVFDDVLVRDNTEADRSGMSAALTRNEHLVLAAIDGVRSVREVLAAVQLPAFDGCRILAQFIGAGLVRRRAS
ncbi:MAG: response regulator [Polyangiaceae bacterium]